MNLNKSMENGCEGNGLTTYIIVVNKCPLGYGFIDGNSFLHKKLQLNLASYNRFTHLICTTP
jgi:hypothetical protein